MLPDYKAGLNPFLTAKSFKFVSKNTTGKLEERERRQKLEERYNLIAGRRTERNIQNLKSGGQISVSWEINLRMAMETASRSLLA